MPDCESRTQRKYSADIASDRIRLPILCFKLIALRSRTGKPRSIQEIHVQMQERLDQVGNGIDRIAVIAVQGHDQVAGGVGEAALVAAAVAAHLPRESPSRPARRHGVRAVGGVVVHHDHFVDELRHGFQHAADPLSSLRQGMITVMLCPLYMLV